MRPHLTVQIDVADHPFVEIPADHVWDLVEYLSFRRPDVTYHFERGFFTVTFRGQTSGHVQKILDDWYASEEINNQHNGGRENELSEHQFSAR